MSVNIMAATSITREQFYAGGPGATDTVCYTVPTDATAKITQITLCNPNSSDRTITVELVSPGGSADGSHLLLSEFVVAGNDTVVLDLAQYLDDGGFINALQSVAGDIVMLVSGEVYL